MQWKGETAEEYDARVKRWHKRFAWFPKKTIRGGWVWLEFIYRRADKRTTHPPFLFWWNRWTWEYITLEDYSMYKNFEPQNPRQSKSLRA